GIAQVDVLYSYEGDVAFDVALIGKRSEDAIAKTFTIELTRDPQRGRWLVASWVPRGVSSPEVLRSTRKLPPAPPVRAPLSARWLLAPLAILAAAAVAGLVAVLRSFLWHRRASRWLAQDLSASTQVTRTRQR